MERKKNVSKSRNNQKIQLDTTKYLWYISINKNGKTFNKKRAEKRRKIIFIKRLIISDKRNRMRKYAERGVNMKLGALSFEISRPTIDSLFESVHKYGFTQLQLHFYQFSDGKGAVASEKMPHSMPNELAEEARAASQKYGVEISAAGGYYNMVSRDLNVRSRGLYDIERLASLCRVFGCGMIALSTGSRSHDPEMMWEIHEENNTQQAWHDICEAMEQALAIAEHYNVCLGVEVEASNVINTPEKARKLIDDMRSPNLKVILDAANLFSKGSAYAAISRQVLGHAFDLLREDIVSVHGKDIKEGAGLDFTYAGNGIVDFDFMIERLKSIGYEGGIILHGNHRESEIPLAVEFMRQKLWEHDCLE